MDAHMETGEPFSDFINIPHGFTDNGHEPQGDFSIANFNLQHQEDLLWDLPLSMFGQNLENQFVDGRAFNNDAPNEQVDFLLPPPPTRSKPRRNRLNEVQKTCLNNWLIAHQTHPYPTSEEINVLAVETLLSEKQVRTWFNNARSRHGLQAIETPDPSIPRTASRHIPISHKIIATETPFQRWRNSPPEDEASVEAIKRTSLTMKYHDSLGYSDPDSGMVSDEILRHGSVASSIGSVSSSMSSRLSAQSSLSLASHNLRRKRKGRRRLYHARSHVTQDKIFVNIECRHCQEHITSSLQTTWEDGKSVIEKIDCPKCSRHIFRGDMSKNNIRTNVFCRTCGCGVDQVRLLQLKYPDQQAFTCHRCLEHLFTIIIGDLPASITALTTPRHEDSEDGRQATSPPRFETRFDCTFCPATFKSRYTWERHETSIHCPQELWICMAAGPTIITNSGSACVFCNLENPTHNHLAKHHNFAACFQRKLSERTFERKDGLQQHLKGVHNQHVISPYMLVHWSQNSMAGPQQWTCGICPAVFSDWNTRLKHIGHHWENGLDMTDWVHRDPWGDIQVDHHAAPRTQASEQHSLIHNNPELPRTAVLGYSASQHLENFRRPIQRSESSATQARPASKPAATFTWKGLFRRLSSA